jgi:energy-coupling factor transport system permease protein
MNLATDLANARGGSWLAACDPRLKLAWLASISLLGVLVDSPLALAALLAMALIPAIDLRMPAKAWLAVTLLLLLMVWGTLLSQGLFYDYWPRSILVTLLPPGDVAGLHFPGLQISREGLWHGLKQSLRLLAMTAAGLTVCLSTSPERLLAALSRLRIPVAIGFLTVTALRFLPVMLAELAIVRQAQRLRGARVTGRHLGSLFLPVLASALRRATSLSASAALRGFDPSARRTFYPPLRFSLLERAALAGLVLLGLAVAAAKGLYWLYLAELFYAPTLRSLYEFAREWL